MIHSINDTNVRDFISLVKEINQGRELYAHVITFGCQQNERDSETVMGLLSEMGYKPTDEAELADIIIINTCAIREHAEAKALSMLGRFKALKKKKPHLLVFLGQKRCDDLLAATVFRRADVAVGLVEHDVNEFSPSYGSAAKGDGIGDGIDLHICFGGRQSVDGDGA